MPKPNRGAKTSGGRKKQPIFMKSTTKGQAHQYAKTEFGVSVDNNNWSLESANAVNEAMFKVKKEFGIGAFGLIDHMGTVASGTASNVQGYYNPLTRGLALRNMRFKNSVQRLQTNAQVQYKNGHWSTNNAMHTVYHELGHGVQRTLSKSQIQAIEKIRTDTLTTIQKTQASGGKAYKSQYLSRYGFSTTGEFIAESVAEHMNGNPRPTAKAVVKIIRGY